MPSWPLASSSFVDVELTHDELSDSRATADALHEEIRLLATNAKGEPCDPLEHYTPKALCAALQGALFEHTSQPVAALYSDDDGGTPAFYVRLNLSDVGSLHALRDRVLASEFEASLSLALNAQRLQEDGTASASAAAAAEGEDGTAVAAAATDEMGAVAPPIERGQSLRQLSMRADLTQFAERYEASALS